MQEAQLAKALAACPSPGAARPRPGWWEGPPPDSLGEKTCEKGGLRLCTSFGPGSLRALLRARKQGEKKGFGGGDQASCAHAEDFAGCLARKNHDMFVCAREHAPKLLCLQGMGKRLKAASQLL